MTKSDILGIINGLETKKAGYVKVKETLEGLLESLQSKKSALEEGVLDPVARPYPLAGDGGEDWAGENYQDAEEKRSDIATALESYDGEIDALMSEITEAIGQLEDAIYKLEQEIAGWWKAYETAPEVEPEEDDD